MSTITNQRNLDFLLYEVFGIADFFSHERYSMHDRTVIGAVLDTAQKIAERYFEPLGKVIDTHEPYTKDGRIHFPSGTREALSRYADAGFTAMPFDLDDGGAQLPYTVSVLASGMFAAANVGLFNYPFLTSANANLIANFGTSEQKARFVPPLLDGRWHGTMCLSEPQAGSSLADITTRALPTDDGQYRIEGSKAWISGGDHELSDNIVHLVLARLPDAAHGVAGISLFIVPRYRVAAAGELGEWNNIALVGINHKMGQKGSVNCTLNFGENGVSLGELVGAPGQGLSCMFQMMNEARITVGLCASAIGQAGFLHALAYAQERRQGRHPDLRDAASTQVPLIEHADVRRLLLAQKAAVEGAQALVTFAASLIDRQKMTSDEKERERLHLLLELLTPVVKSWPSEHCLEANKHAIQVLGGYGYTRDFPVERLYRDNRLNHIHEGTYAIHGIDLVGRKIRAQNGAALEILRDYVSATIADAQGFAELADHAAALARAMTALRATTDKIIACDDRRKSMALATVYLDAFGHICVAWQWLWQAVAACEALEISRNEADFYDGKLAACRYFFRYELPGVHARLALVGSLDDTCLSVTAAQLA